MTYAEAAVEIMAEDGETRVWMGLPNLWHGIYERKHGHNNAHPINQWRAVYDALRRSPLFVLAGHIAAPGFTTSREIAHPVFMLQE